MVRKQEVFVNSDRKYQNHAFEYVLITAEFNRVTQDADEGFDKAITLERIFDEKYW